MRWGSKTRTTLSENLDLIGGSVLSGVVAVLGVIGVASNAVVSATVLAVLALVMGLVVRVRNQLHFDST